MANSVKVEGLDKIQKEINKRLLQISEATPRAINDCALDLMGKSVPLAPIDTGDLRGSAHVDNATSSHMTAILSYQEVYALRQHEELSYNHPKGGQAKYLEQPFKENSNKYVQHIKDSVRKVVK